MSDLRLYTDQMREGKDLTETQSTDALTIILTGQATESEAFDWLKALDEKQETIDEIVGFARAMRTQMVPVPLSSPAVDLCGTGGSGRDRFNISTAAAFVLSAAGVGVAKHGNRGSKQPNGSFDFLEALDIQFDLTPDQISSVYDQTNLCFLFARAHHPTLKFLAPIRKSIGKRTVFNILGPLCNPAGVNSQIIGTTSTQLAKKLSGAIQRLGTDATWVIVGGDGLDELAICKPSEIYKINDGVTQSEFNPVDIGISGFTEDDLIGGTAQENAKLFIELISTQNTTHPISKMICLNAAAAKSCAKKIDIKTAYSDMLAFIKEGTVYSHYQQFKKVLGLV